MKNLLIVFPHLIYPLDSGGAQAIFNGIMAVKDHYNTSLIYFEGRKDRHAKEREELERLLGNVKIFPFFYSPNRLHRLKGIEKMVEGKLLRNMSEWKNLCWSETYMPMEGYMEFVNKIVAEENIDLVQLEMMESLPLVLGLPEQVKKVFVHHEIRFVRNEMKLNAMKMKNSFNRATVEQKRILEIGMLNRCDGVMTLSEIDKRKLEQAGVFVPVFTSLAIVQQRTMAEGLQKHHSLTFVGPEYHAPNYNGLMWFLDNCWPILQSEVPDYQLHIIGKWSEAAKKKIQEKYSGIEFMGFVEDLTSALQGSVMIVPIHEGSGIRMKILEAASMGVPVVTTSVGVEGIPLVNGKSCVIDDSPEGFVRGIYSLEDESYRAKLVQEAREIVKIHYSMEALTRNRLEFYRQMGV